MEHRTWSRFRLWLTYYAVTFAASFVAMWLLHLCILLDTWKTVAFGIWLLCCFASLCLSEESLERWLPHSRGH